jgi:hypothetical protein
MNKEDMGGTCSTHGGNEKCVHNFSRKPEGKNAREDVCWIDLAQDRM